MKNRLDKLKQNRRRNNAVKYIEHLESLRGLRKANAKVRLIVFGTAYVIGVGILVLMFK